MIGSIMFSLKKLHSTIHYAAFSVHGIQSRIVRRVGNVASREALILPTLKMPSNPERANLQAFYRDLQSGRNVAIVTIPSYIFSTPLRPDIILRCSVFESARDRGIVVNTQKSKADVSGGGRKRRPQKGQGRARVGDNRSPIFKGGFSIPYPLIHFRYTHRHFCSPHLLLKGGWAWPRKTRDFTLKLPWKVRSFGMRSVLASKYAANQLFIVDNLKCSVGAHQPSLPQILESNSWHLHGAKTLFLHNDFEHARVANVPPPTMPSPVASANDNLSSTPGESENNPIVTHPTPSSIDANASEAQRLSDAKQNLDLITGTNISPPPSIAHFITMTEEFKGQVKVVACSDMSVRDLLKYDHAVITKAALQYLGKYYWNY